MGFETLWGKRVGMDEEMPGLLGFVLRKKRRIVLVLDLQWFFLQTRSRYCSLRWVLLQLVLLGVPKGLLLFLQISVSRFRKRKQLFKVACHFVTTYEQKGRLTTCTRVWYWASLSVGVWQSSNLVSSLSQCSGQRLPECLLLGIVYMCQRRKRVRNI